MFPRKLWKCHAYMKKNFPTHDQFSSIFPLYCSIRSHILSSDVDKYFFSFLRFPKNNTMIHLFIYRHRRWLDCEKNARHFIECNRWACHLHIFFLPSFTLAVKLSLHNTMMRKIYSISILIEKYFLFIEKWAKYVKRKESCMHREKKSWKIFHKFFNEKFNLQFVLRVYF